MERISHFKETTSMPMFRSRVGLILNFKKRLNLPVVLMILLLGSSCQKEPIMRFGFDTDFGNHSHGLTIMNVSSSAKSITLRGEVSVNEGEVLVELIDPSGSTAFTSHLLSPDSQYLNESFHAVSGNWKLKYKSIEGEGTIILHLVKEYER